ncbi:hypothetical protein VitviT2T_004540 [Vitis vinifera]|uniref:F-box domain-containing protein n=2 Tax=Vitis vinifera TaxID=29760 RepID=A0ABY9BQY0_VITVI|nr:F-box protein AFR [Vitis vinifera]RVW52308.1 F-box protein AFR [Vitis vinifera]WJZ84968.1 hypothetical protein VitviT2T_004540 [Vitis vinifera]|eukprot:XP_002282492.1 PREDICTED: F-box protein AFR [Vitis vinifera]
MVRLRSSSNSQENDGNSDELIPGLPEEIAELCLLHVPYPYQALARSVSSSWNKAITDPSFLLSKKILSLSQPYLFVFASSKSTSRIQWQALDPRSGRWFVLPPMPCSAAACPPGLACASLPEDGKLFVLGDLRSDGTSLHTTIMYRASTNQWSLASPMRTPRTFFAAGSINGKIFAAGGRGLGVEDSIPTVERYDPVSDTWAAVAKMRSGLARYDAAVVGNKLYVTEGWTWPFSFSPRGGVYDGDRDTWQEMSLGMREGWTGISVVLRNRLFVLSEYGDCRMKVYVPDHDTWHPVGGGRFPCEALQRPFAVSTMEDRIYVVSRGLHVAVGKVHETVEASQSHHLWVEWEVMAAPIAFSDFSPCNCQPLYA